MGGGDAVVVGGGGVRRRRRRRMTACDGVMEIDWFVDLGFEGDARTRLLPPENVYLNFEYYTPKLSKYLQSYHQKRCNKIIAVFVTKRMFHFQNHHVLGEHRGETLKYSSTPLEWRILVPKVPKAAALEQQAQYSQGYKATIT